MDKYINVICIVGLIIIICLLLLLRRSYKKHPGSSKNMTAKKAVLLTACAVLVLAGLIIGAGYLSDASWNILAPI